MYKSSKTSLRSYGKFGTRAKSKNRKSMLKPYNFCCDVNDRDDETRYDKREPPFSSSLMVLSPIQESPMLKFRFRSVEPAVYAREKRKGSKSKSQSENWNSNGNSCVKTREPLLWYQEDEIELARDGFWSKKQRIYNEEADKNALIGEKKVKGKLTSAVDASGPRWYQDLSIQQMKQVLALGDTMTADYEETITVRTRNALAVIGVTSTFFKIAPQVIKKLHRSSRLRPVQFLREIYKRASGRYFEEEEYKKTYGCNERIILSSIAFLALPDAVIELNKRLPSISKPVFPPKPKIPRIPIISGSSAKSPYMEPLFLPPDWVAYRKCVDAWRAKCLLVPRPRVILPRVKYGDKSSLAHLDFGNEKADEIEEGSNVERSKTGLTNFTSSKKEEQIGRNIGENEETFQATKNPFHSSIPRLSAGDKQTFDFTISGLGEKSGPVNYKICGTLKPPFPKRKSWLGEKEAHYVISGISEHEDPPQCPVTYVMTGISCVTPDNSDEQFFAELKLGDGSNKRVYPSGRKNLSKNWQEWLQNADEEFIEVEREANKLIKNVEATMRLVIPGNRCDACCSCRQTRKADIKFHATKTPYMVIDSIAEGDNQSKYIVGSLAMHSPALSPVESTVNLLEVVASKETVEKKLVINGVTNDEGETTFYISGVTEDTEYTPKMTKILKERPPKPLRNVPPCVCTIEQIFNEGKTAPSESGDDIPQTKKKGICLGRKYRPNESPAFTCKDYPDDKSCRRNPFDFNNKLKRGSAVTHPETYETSHDETSNQGAAKAKRMFTLPEFSPCGDEDGMAICGGPWGKKNVPSPEILAAREAEAKKILRAPPCGDTPGRAVCGGAWGATNPSPKAPKAKNEEDEDEEEEEEEEEEGEKKNKLRPREIAKLAREAEAEEKKMRKKLLKRDNLCSERFEDETTEDHPLAKKIRPVRCEFDNLWDRTRTAPTVNPWNNEYEKSLKLTGASSVVPNSDERERSKLSTKHRNRDEHKTTRSNERMKDNVEVIYGGKQAARNQPRSVNLSNAVNDQRSGNKARGFGKENRASSSSAKRLKEPPKETSKSVGGTSKLKNGIKDFSKIKESSEVKNNRKSAGDKKTKKGNNNRYERNETSMKNYRNDKRDKESSSLRKLKRQNESQNTRHQTPRKLENVARPKKTMCQITTRPSSYAKQFPPLLNTDKKLNIEYNKISPAIIPENPRLPCQRDTADSDDEYDNCGCSNEEEPNVSTKEGPFGWRTKSQQELPREKTLAYLAEPDDDEVEMVKLREGGRPCKCRENRNKKKILLYNIGGTVSVSKGRKEGAQAQVIEGVTYVTPPQSPRNSEEYIPEYEIFESPYKKCVRKRTNKDLKYVQELSTFRSLLPRKKSNVELCPCGRDHSVEESTNDDNIITKEIARSEDAENSAKATSSRWSSALKDEGLVDHFVSCRDAVPCWLKCEKFSKAGCCTKPKLLQVKKPVCECRYERRVVRREEEKKSWVDRQRRLKTAKKQPYVQIGGTSRPMGQETKLMISSVKKVLKEGEFIPEAQYCVTGVAENYAMGPPHHVIPGITMQSPLITPEPSKPDILCMCGHRHWSPTDITALNGAEGSSVRAKGEYPCRGREQDKKTGKNISPNLVTAGDSEHNNISEPYVAYQNCADHVRACNPAVDEGQQTPGKKRKLISGSGEITTNDATGQGSKKLKFQSEKVSQDEKGGTRDNYIEQTTTEMKMSKPKGNESSEGSKNKRTTERDHPTQQNVSNSDNTSDLFELMKLELEKMSNEDFVLAKLPECWLIPQLKSWIEYREGAVLTDSMNEQLCDISSKRWGMMQQTKKPSVPPPSLNLSQTEAAKMTFDRAIEMKKKIHIVREKYFSEVRQMRVCEARSYWPTMEFGRFPSLSFKEAYFTYMPGKEADGHVFRPWKIGESK